MCPTHDSAASQPLSRRRMLGMLGAGGIGAAAGGALGFAGGRATADGSADGSTGAGGFFGGGSQSASDPGELTYPFDGEHQAGIITPAQDRMHFAAFDMVDDATRDDLIDLLERWTAAARRLPLGGEVSARGAFGGGPNFPPDDTGEAYDLGPAGLTLTFGFGRTLFTSASSSNDAEGGTGTDRFGIADRMPADFTELPVMANDFLIPEKSGGDLCIQACANDPQVASHAIRNLTRMAMGVAVLKWSQIGFGRTSSTSQSQKTPRNLFGQKDGTMNLKAEEPERLAEHVWIGDGDGDADGAWAAGGTYLTARRITMTIEVWDSLQLEEQERVTGRDKVHGAPLTGGDEFDQPDFSARDNRGLPVVDERSHVFRVHPDNNGGVRMLRRGYNFIDGNDDQGRLDAGLFFIAFTRTPERFARVHQNMARDDMFLEYLKTTSSAVFLVPPGVGAEGYVGQGLFEG
ncbi:Dyp-type peroxidase [Corynebacterium sp. NPDC060344]|uniref:Dyp-type peroxidase n=1 Tax=Corynebacterium sp. NPDC060344 TaxID=3347101 RepID=UPI00364CB5C6